ncbi:hypothetical protein LTS12_026237, partial [Elasticomyces elasticus]
ITGTSSQVASRCWVKVVHKRQIITGSNETDSGVSRYVPKQLQGRLSTFTPSTLSMFAAEAVNLIMSLSTRSFLNQRLIGGGKASLEQHYEQVSSMLPSWCWPRRHMVSIMEFSQYKETSDGTYAVLQLPSLSHK